MPRPSNQLILSGQDPCPWRAVVFALLLLIAGVAGVPMAQEPRPASDEAFFAAQVAPILERNCFACHGPLRQRGGLRLDSRPAMLVGGESGPAIVPGSASESLLFQAVLRDGGLEMPPPRPLEDAEIATLSAWLDAGALWPDGPGHELKAAVRVSAREVPRVTHLAVSDFEAAEPVSFNQHVRPLLSKHCYECHGPDEEAREAGLRLDTREGALAVLPSGRRAVTPGDLASSQLFHRIAALDPRDRMPPAEGPEHQLSDREVEQLAAFILQGAEWQPHWAFVPPERPRPPTLANDAGVRNPIDRFVLARLHDEGLSPSPEASRRTLIRRLSLDLTGLPPTTGEVEVFLGDLRADAYERLVDRLLASPRYGEHAARYWLDAARYADTNGYHIDNERFMWRWREWVIDAFNDNQPFDQFTIDQLAGDLLPEPTHEQLVATGFHRNHMINFEGGAIPEEYRTQYVFDRVDTTATVWLGMTVGCAKCHDHKYDPISQLEYYQLAAFFNSIDEEGLDGMDGNAEPYLLAPDEAQQLARNRLLEDLAPLYSLLDDPKPEVDRAMEQWRKDWQRELSRRWQSIVPGELVSENGAEFEYRADGSVLVVGPNPDTDTLEVIADVSATGIRALRLEALRDDRLPEGGIGRSVGEGTFTLTTFEVAVAMPGEPFGEPIEFAFAMADHRHPATPVALAIDEGETTGWSADFAGKETKRVAVFFAQEPFDAPAGSRIRVRLHHNSQFAQRVIGRFRLALSNDPALALGERSGWSWSGPYPDFEPPENAPGVPDLEARYDDGRLVWVPAAAMLATEDARDPFEAEIFFPPGTTRLYRLIDAPSERTSTLSIAADGYRFWLNGEPVASCPPKSRSLVKSAPEAEKEEPDQEDCRAGRLDLHLESGANHLFAEIWTETTDPAERSPFRAVLEQETSGVLPFALETLLTTSDEQLTEEEANRLRRHYRRNLWPGFANEEKRFAALEAELEELDASIPTTMVMAEREKARPTFLLERGQYDLLGEQVHATTPAVLPSIPVADGANATRLDLARWLVDPQHPLTARVTVNRLWQRFFGHGLVKTSEDFGTQGQAPSHPGLLDWLATEFVASGWDMKALQRLIVTSATYRQSAAVSPQLLQRDPENRLLARASRFRLDAEVLRDSALVYADLLVEKLGGPGVNPYQPPGLWKEIGYESDGRFSASEFTQGEGEDLYRRSLYTFWKRTVPPPNMLVFDAPNRETCTVKRGISNTPLQALTLLNDPQYVEAARGLAERLLSEGPAGDEERFRMAFEIVLSRPPSEKEVATLRRLRAVQLAHFESTPGAAEELLDVGDSAVPDDLPSVELAAWTLVASVILNLDETLNRP